ncbi:hypothetical protein DFH28DRAFT_983508 [Melampsora americana]|nr:hypothetical protein DFH28DRAFT_983508 [Melampsora americana]
MSDPSTQGFLSNLSTLSASPHPYAALADYLTVNTKVPVRPVWAQVLSMFIIVTNLFMLIGSLWICAIRIQHKRFTLGSITKDRFIRPNPAVCMAVGSAGYCICEIIQQMSILFMEHDISNIDGRLALYGIKFMFVWLVAWCYAWGSVGHHICNIWDPPWQRNVPQDVKARIPPLIVHFMNFTFVLLTCVAVIFIYSIFIFVDVEQRRTVEVYEAVKIALRDLDRSSSGFDLPTALLTLEPLTRIISVTNTFISHLKVGIAGWIFFGFLQALLQAICICLIISERRKMAVSFNFKETITSIFKTTERNHKSSAINFKKEQTILLFISMTMMSSVVSYLPVAIISYFVLQTPADLRKVKFSLVMELPPSLYITLINSIYVSLTLSQTLRISKAKQRSSARASQIIQGFPVSQQIHLREPIKSFQSDKQRTRNPTLSGSTFITRSSLLILPSPLKLFNNSSIV